MARRTRTPLTRAALVEAAAAVFLEHGYERGSMALIAARVGGSKASVYAHYASKVELFDAVMASVVERRFGRVFIALEQDEGETRAALQQFGVRMLQAMCTQRSLSARRAAIAEAGHAAVGRSYYDSGPRIAIERTAAYFERTMRRGLMRSEAPQLAAQQLLALLEAQTVQLCLYGVIAAVSEDAIAAAAQQAVDMFWRAYQPAAKD